MASGSIASAEERMVHSSDAPPRRAGAPAVEAADDIESALQPEPFPPTGWVELNRHVRRRTFATLVVRLHLANCDLPPSPWDWLLSVLPRLANLVDLSLANTGLDDHRAKALMTALSGGDRAAAAAQAGRSPGRAGGALRSAATDHRRGLVSLNLSHNGLTARAAQRLGAFVAHAKALQVLDVASNRFLDHGLQVLAAHFKCAPPTLVNVAVCSNGSSIRGIVDALVGLSESVNLRDLDVSGNVPSKNLSSTASHITQHTASQDHHGDSYRQQLDGSPGRDASAFGGGGGQYGMTTMLLPSPITVEAAMRDYDAHHRSVSEATGSFEVHHNRSVSAASSATASVVRGARDAPSFHGAQQGSASPSHSSPRWRRASSRCVYQSTPLPRARLEALRTRSPLRILNLGGCALAPQHALDLLPSLALSSPRLQCLWLPNNALGDAALWGLVNAAETVALQELDARPSNRPVTVFRKLSLLDLSMNGITDEGLLHLATLLTLNGTLDHPAADSLVPAPVLEDVSLAGNHVTAVGMAEFLAQLFDGGFLRNRAHKRGPALRVDISRSSSPLALDDLQMLQSGLQLLGGAVALQVGPGPEGETVDIAFFGDEPRLSSSGHTNDDAQDAANDDAKSVSELPLASPPPPQPKPQEVASAAQRQSTTPARGAQTEDSSGGFFKSPSRSPQQQQGRQHDEAAPEAPSPKRQPSSSEFEEAKRVALAALASTTVGSATGSAPAAAEPVAPTPDVSAIATADDDAAAGPVGITVTQPTTVFDEDTATTVSPPPPEQPSVARQDGTDDDAPAAGRAGPSVDEDAVAPEVSSPTVSERDDTHSAADVEETAAAPSTSPPAEVGIVPSSSGIAGMAEVNESFVTVAEPVDGSRHADSPHHTATVEGPGKSDSSTSTATTSSTTSASIAAAAAATGGDEPSDVDSALAPPQPPGGLTAHPSTSSVVPLGPQPVFSDCDSVLETAKARLPRVTGLNTLQLKHYPGHPLCRAFHAPRDLLLPLTAADLQEHLDRHLEAEHEGTGAAGDAGRTYVHRVVFYSSGLVSAMIRAKPKDRSSVAAAMKSAGGAESLDDLPDGTTHESVQQCWPRVSALATWLAEGGSITSLPNGEPLPTPPVNDYEGRDLFGAFHCRAKADQPDVNVVSIAEEFHAKHEDWVELAAQLNDGEWFDKSAAAHAREHRPRHSAQTAPAVAAAPQTAASPPRDTAAAAAEEASPGADTVVSRGEAAEGADEEDLAAAIATITGGAATAAAAAHDPSEAGTDEKTTNFVMRASNGNGGPLVLPTAAELAAMDKRRGIDPATLRISAFGVAVSAASGETPDLRPWMAPVAEADDEAGSGSRHAASSPSAAAASDARGGTDAASSPSAPPSPPRAAPSSPRRPVFGAPSSETAPPTSDDVPGDSAGAMAAAVQRATRSSSEVFGERLETVIIGSDDPTQDQQQQRQDTTATHTDPAEEHVENARRRSRGIDPTSSFRDMVEAREKQLRKASMRARSSSGSRPGTPMAGAAGGSATEQTPSRGSSSHAAQHVPDSVRRELQRYQARMSTPDMRRAAEAAKSAEYERMRRAQALFQATYMFEMMGEITLPEERRNKRPICKGTTADGTKVTVAVEWEDLLIIKAVTGIGGGKQVLYVHPLTGNVPHHALCTAAAAPDAKRSSTETLTFILDRPPQRENRQADGTLGPPDVTVVEDPPTVTLSVKLGSDWKAAKATNELADSVKAAAARTNVIRLTVDARAHAPAPQDAPQ